MVPGHMDELIVWLGLDDVTEPTWRETQIGVTVTVQGDFRPADWTPGLRQTTSA